MGEGVVVPFPLRREEMPEARREMLEIRGYLLAHPEARRVILDALRARYGVETNQPLSYPVGSVPAPVERRH